MRDICELQLSSFNHLVNLLSHSLNFQRRCFRRSSMFLYAQLMLRICTVNDNNGGSGLTIVGVPHTAPGARTGLAEALGSNIPSLYSQYPSDHLSRR